MGLVGCGVMGSMMWLWGQLWGRSWGYGVSCGFGLCPPQVLPVATATAAVGVGLRGSEGNLALGASILETGAAMLEASTAILKPGAAILSGRSVEELGGGGGGGGGWEEVST